MRLPSHETGFDFADSLHPACYRDNTLSAAAATGLVDFFMSQEDHLAWYLFVPHTGTVGTRQAAGAMLDDYAARDEVAILGWPVCAGPKVRIRLPPAWSLVRSCGGVQVGSSVRVDADGLIVGSKMAGTGATSALARGLANDRKP
jgi:hypothetical protein